MFVHTLFQPTQRGSFIDKPAFQSRSAPGLACQDSCCWCGCKAEYNHQQRTASIAFGRGVVTAAVRSASNSHASIPTLVRDVSSWRLLP